MPVFNRWTHMIDGLISGEVMGDPERRQGKGDSTFVVARIKAQTNDGDHWMVNVIAFDDDPCQALLGLRDGDSVAATGNLTPKVWTDKQGNVKPALDLVAHRVIAVCANR